MDNIVEQETGKPNIITVRGRNTKALTEDPQRGKGYELLLNRPYEFSVLHPRQDIGIIILPAFGGHTGGIPLDLEMFAEKYEASIVTTQHPKWTFSPEFAVAQFKDIIEEQGFKEVVLIGPSLGGTLALEVLKDYKKKEDQPYNIKGLVMIGSPSCRADLKPSWRAKLKLAEELRGIAVRAYRLRRDPEEVIGEDATGAEQSDAEFFGQIIRASALLKKPPKPEEYPDIPILCLTLPEGRDQIVKDEAKNRLKKVFPQTFFETFNAREHSQKEYIAHAEEIGGKIKGFLDPLLLPSG